MELLDEIDEVRSARQLDEGAVEALDELAVEGRYYAEFMRQFVHDPDRAPNPIDKQVGKDWYLWDRRAQHALADTDRTDTTVSRTQVSGQDEASELPIEHTVASFAAEVRAAQRFFHDEVFATAEPAIREAFTRPVVADDASEVEVLVTKFARSELEGIGVGRYRWSQFPPLGVVAKDHLARLGSADAADVRAAIVRAVAKGYAFGGADRLAPSQRHPSKLLWETWTMELTGDPLERLMPADLLEVMRAIGAAAFLEDARRLGLPTADGDTDSEVGRLGAWYANAGCLLAILQKAGIDPSPRAVSHWPYDA
jgi:hypothetical protein